MTSPYARDAGWLRGALAVAFAPERRSWAGNDGLDPPKLAALVLMAVGHVLVALPAPWSDWGYVAGRPCVPIFVFIMVARLSQGGTDRSLRMLWRLLVWGVIAQPVYHALVGQSVLRLNILFTLAIAAGLIHLLGRRNYLLAALVAAPLLVFDLYLDGGAVTPIGAALAYLFCQRSPVAALALVTLAGLVSTFTFAPESWAPLVAVLAAPVIVWGSAHLNGAKLRLPRIAFYAFYPLHLWAIWLVFGPYHG
jgi:hypothetical protein